LQLTLDIELESNNSNAYTFLFVSSQRLSRSQVQVFIEENELGYKPISNSERDTHMAELQALHTATKWWVTEKASQTEWYKVPFTEVLPLVAKRTCFVTGGMAYVPQMDIVTILSQRFRTSLSQQVGWLVGDDAADMS
jgi:DNA primase large subunit